MLHRSGFGSLGILILLLMPYAFVGSMILQPVNQVEEFTPSQTGWLSGWHYRKSHTISGSVGAGTNYQVRITVHRSSGVDSGEDVYVESKCNVDFGDIRFTDDDGMTNLDYWLQEYDSSHAIFWVEISDNLDDEVSIYIYYGNTGVSSISNGDDTFLFFDDFEDTLGFPKWNYIQGDVFTNAGCLELVSNGTSDQRGIIKSNTHFSIDCAVHMRGRSERSVFSLIHPMGLVDGIEGPSNNFVDWYGNGDFLTGDNGAVTLHTASLSFDSITSWHIYKMTWTDSAASIYQDGNLIDSISTNIPHEYLNISCVEGAVLSDIWYSDWLFVRNCVDDEPTHSSWGSEEVASWLTGWQYRKSHTISGSVGAGTNYQVRITVHRSTGTDSGEDVYVGTKCRSDFGDVRFTDDDGATLLDYWLEESDSSQAMFWVEVADNLDDDVSLYLYYGNDESTSVSDGEATFIFFDDFDDGSLDIAKWDSFGPWTESDGVATFSITSTGIAQDWPTLRSNSGWDMRNKAFAMRWQFDENTVNAQWGMSCTNDNVELSYFIGGSHDPPIDSLYFDTDHTTSAYDFHIPIGLWPIGSHVRTEFASTPDGITKNEWWLNHESVGTYNGNSFDGDPQKLLLGYWQYGRDGILNTGNLKMDLDWIYLRTIIGTEPSHGQWDAEVIGPTTTSPTTTSPVTTPTPPPVDMTVLVILGISGGGIAIIVIIIIFLKRRPVGDGTSDTGYSW